MINKKEKWAVMYQNEIVETFRNKAAAYGFVYQNNKHYFYCLTIEELQQALKNMENNKMEEND